jgi:hypothetical protein
LQNLTTKSGCGGLARRLGFAKRRRLGQMLPALRLPEPLPFLIGMQDGLLPTQQRHRAATLSVFHQFLPDRFLKSGVAYTTIIMEVLQPANLSDRRRANIG